MENQTAKAVFQLLALRLLVFKHKAVVAGNQ